MNNLEPSAPPPYNNIMAKSQLINNIMNKYEIDHLFGEKLSILEDYEIVLLLDDSGSMNTPLSEGPNKTRWEEYFMDIQELVEDVEENAMLDRDTSVNEQKLRKLIRDEFKKLS